MFTITIYRDAAGEYRWSARAANNRKVGASGEGYVNRGDCVDEMRALLMVDGRHDIRVVEETDGSTQSEKGEEAGR